MAQSSNMFIKVKGIDDSGYGDVFAGKEKPIHSAKGWYPIVHWSWGATNQAKHIDTQTTSGGMADVHDVTITHYMDNAASGLATMCLSGKPVDLVELMCRNPLGEKYIYLKLEQCIVSGVNMGGSDEGGSELQQTTHIHYNNLLIETSKGGKGSNQATWKKP
jgi:type VI secretion system secreted protein Hcp